MGPPYPKILETPAGTLGDGRSVTISQGTHQIDELAYGFDREHVVTPRLHHCSGCSAGICPCAGHFHRGAVSQADREHNFVGLDYFQFPAIKRMVLPRYLDPRRQILK